MSKTQTISFNCRNCKIAKHCLFGLFVSDDKILKTEDLVERKRVLNPGQALIHQLDRQRYIYVVHSGSLKGRYIDITGREHVTNFYYPSEILGIEFLFYGKFLVDIVALETCSLCYINLTRFKECLNQSSELRERLVNICSQHLWLSYSTRGSHTAIELVIYFLLNLKSQVISGDDHENQLELSMKRDDIGNYLGLSSETVSRALTKLKTNGLITVNKNSIKLNNVEQLKKLATHIYPFHLKVLDSASL